MEALFTDGDHCRLCSHHCHLTAGKTGLCRVRQGMEVDGKTAISIPYYGLVSSLAMDPIEKKPLYHWHPGSMLLSAGFLGCNLHCPFCQNWEISQTVDAATRYFSPADLIGEVRHAHSFALAYTYSEPLVHIEYLLDCMAEARKIGIKNVLVSNGCVEEMPAKAVLALTDACNIDLKTSSFEDYREKLGGDLGAVQRFISLASEMGVHTEVTTLVVTGFNDTIENLMGSAHFIASVSPEIPWHLSAYHPAFRWREPRTERAIMDWARDEASDLLRHIHLGNV